MKEINIDPITRLEGQRSETKLLVYPATPDTIEQTKVILRDARRP